MYTRRSLEPIRYSVLGQNQVAGAAVIVCFGYSTISVQQLSIRTPEKTAYQNNPRVGLHIF